MTSTILGLVVQADPNKRSVLAVCHLSTLPSLEQHPSRGTANISLDNLKINTCYKLDSNVYR